MNRTLFILLIFILQNIFCNQTLASNFDENTQALRGGNQGSFRGNTEQYLPAKPPQSVLLFYRFYSVEKEQTANLIKSVYGTDLPTILNQVHAQLLNIGLVAPRKYCVNPFSNPYGAIVQAQPLVNLSIDNLTAIYLVYPALKEDIQKEFLKFISNNNVCPGERAMVYSLWYWLSTLQINSQDKSFLPLESQLPSDIVDLMKRFAPAIAPNGMNQMGGQTGQTSAPMNPLPQGPSTVIPGKVPNQAPFQPERPPVGISSRF